MNGDFTRFPIARVADSLYPLQQQGRVHLDADWNELAASLTDSVRLSIDALLGGSAAVGTGFKGSGQADESLSFESGTYFVGGYRVVAPSAVQLGDQPFQPAADVEFPPKEGDGDNTLFYLDVWVRHVTARSRPELAEVALRGPDTTTRGILTWQVRAIRITEATANTVRSGWLDIEDRIRPRTRATMRAWLELAETLEPCLDDIAGGYTGPNNQLYRFEVAKAPPPLDAAELVPDARVVLWSRDNASFESRIRSRDGTSVELISDPTTPALVPGGIVQLVDDFAELGGLSNPPARITSADPDEDRVALDAPPMTLDVVAAGDTHARLRHWDGMLELTEEMQEVEHGLRIELKDAEKALVGDYWVVPARTNGALLWPDDRRWPMVWKNDWPDDFRPPHGVDHMFAPLALVVAGTALDCRWTVGPLRKP